ncbi:hypothetical protein OUZ56_029328 [Daphnia magna]|uniref:Uncharacterized protein n=1 Tax=Daphnia magna TaxID=35525 RepID=A0ABR0B6Y8_9CRUS|nr:hypothetical protein OUZ56_029328 [Daphnia magna]
MRLRHSNAFDNRTTAAFFNLTTPDCLEDVFLLLVMPELCCLPASLDSRFRSHVYCESDHASVTENGSLHWRHQNSSAIAEIIGK